MKRFFYLCFLVGISIFASGLAIEFVSSGVVNIESIQEAAWDGLQYGLLGGGVLKVFDNFPDTTDKK